MLSATVQFIMMNVVMLSVIVVNFVALDTNVARKHKLECSFQSSLMFELSLEPISVSPGLTSKY